MLPWGMVAGFLGEDAIVPGDILMRMGIGIHPEHVNYIIRCLIRSDVYLYAIEAGLSIRIVVMHHAQAVNRSIS